MEEENNKKTEDNIKVLRTYTSDMADAIRTNEESVIKIALAEKNKRERDSIYKKAEGSKFSKIAFLIAGVIFILSATLGTNYLIKLKKEKEIITQQPSNKINTFMSYDSYSSIDITNIENIDQLSAIIRQNDISNSGLIKVLFLTKNINGFSEIIKSKDFFSLIHSNIPSTLSRSMSDDYLIGRYLSGYSLDNEDQQDLFLIFKSNNYNQSYASMLEWEKIIFRDLYILYDKNITEKDSGILNRDWKDIIIDNRDARVLYNKDGLAVLYYMFLNKTYIIITNKIDTLKEITARLLIQNTRPF